MGVHQGFAGPADPAYRWVFLRLFSGPGRPGPWKWKEHVHRRVVAWERSAGCPAEGQWLVSKQGLCVAAFCPYLLRFLQLSGGGGDAPPRPHARPPRNQAACPERPGGPQWPPPRSQLARRPHGPKQGNGLWWLGCVWLWPASSRRPRSAPERFLHGHSPPSAGVTRPPSPKPSCTDYSASRDSHLRVLYTPRDLGSLFSLHAKPAGPSRLFLRQ